MDIFIVGEKYVCFSHSKQMSLEDWQARASERRLRGKKIAKIDYNKLYTIVSKAFFIQALPDALTTAIIQAYNEGKLWEDTK